MSRKPARSPQPKDAALTPGKPAKHDPRIVELVRAIARQQAAEDFDAEIERRKQDGRQAA